MAQIFDAFGPYYGNSEMYSMSRRQRSRDLGGIETGVSVAVGAEVAEMEGGNGTMSAILIGVATGALTFVVTRVIERTFFSKPPRRARRA